MDPTQVLMLSKQRLNGSVSSVHILAVGILLHFTVTAVLYFEKLHLVLYHLHSMRN